MSPFYEVIGVGMFIGFWLGLGVAGFVLFVRDKRRARRISQGIKEEGEIMQLRTAKLCIDCEEIFQREDRCPKCGGSEWKWLSHWLVPICAPAALEDLCEMARVG